MAGKGREDRWRRWEEGGRREEGGREIGGKREGGGMASRTGERLGEEGRGRDHKCQGGKDSQRVGGVGEDRVEDLESRKGGR